MKDRRCKLQEVFEYGNHTITVLNFARRRHVNRGNENNECEIPTVRLKLLIRNLKFFFCIKVYFVILVRINGLSVTVGILHSLFSFPCLFTWRRYVYLSRAELSTVIAWLPYPGASCNLTNNMKKSCNILIVS